MLHLVVCSAILDVCEVENSGPSAHHQFLPDGCYSIIVHISGLHIMLAGYQPRLQQVLVETIPQSSQGHMFWRRGGNCVIRLCNAGVLEYCQLALLIVPQNF